jgi:hypothetical protein
MLIPRKMIGKLDGLGWAACYPVAVQINIINSQIVPKHKEWFLQGS